MGEVEIFTTIAFFIAFLSFMSLISPPEYRVIDTFDFVWFAGGLIGVASACVIATGIPCAGALAIFGIVSIWQYLIVNFEWLKLLIFFPLVIVIIYIVSRLGRGGG